MTRLDITGHLEGVALAFTDDAGGYELIAVFDSLAQAGAAKREAERLSQFPPMQKEAA